MKILKIIIISTFIAAGVTCKAQKNLSSRTIIPVENAINYEVYPDHSYFKDIHHLFDDYVGTWTGSYKDKTYLITIEKVTTTFLDVKEDALYLRYKITNAKDQVLVNTLEMPLGISEETPLGNKYLIVGLNSMANITEKYILDYTGYKSRCGQYGRITLKNIAKGQLKLKLKPTREFLTGFDCPTGVPAEQVFPTDSFMTLTRQ